MSDQPPVETALASIIANPRQALVAVDFDGTLSPIVADPHEAKADDAAMAAFARVGEVVGAVAIVTGRSPRMVMQLADLDRPGLSDLTILGQYGAERWDAATGEFRELPPPPGIAALATELPGFLREWAIPAELEDKGRAIGLHLRNTTDPEWYCNTLRAPLAELAAAYGLVVRPGRLILEVCEPGHDKGTALRELVAERGVRSIVYCGDDLGDLPAYDALDALRAEGFSGIKVCAASPEQSALTSRADVVVDGVGGITSFLSDLASRCQRVCGSCH